MLMIRFRRIGKKNKPTYRLTVAEHTKPVNGSFVADVGFYNPHTKVAGLKSELILDWLKKGAKPSNSVAKLLQREKIKHNSIVVIKKNKKAKVADKKAEKPVVPADKVAENVEAPTEPVSEESTPKPEESEPIADTPEPLADQKTTPDESAKS